MTEPQFWGDLAPPDHPAVGDVWLAKGVRRVRLEHGWDPYYPEYRDYVRNSRVNGLRKYWQRRKLFNARVRIVKALRRYGNGNI
jgi:hypothetical protein